MKKLNLLTFAILFWSVALILQFVVGLEVDMATVRQMFTIAMLPVMVLALMLAFFYWDMATFFKKNQ